MLNRFVNSAWGLWYRSPSTIRLPMNIFRRAGCWRSKGIIFIHVPKAAGVSVSKALYGRPLGHFYASAIQRLLPRLFDECFTFAVVRHPVDRLYSAYRFSTSGGTAEMGMAKSDIYRQVEFASFETFVENWLVHQDLRKVDGVFRPQYMYLCEDKKIIVDRWYKLENMQEMVDDLSARMGSAIQIGHHNQTDTKSHLDMSEKTLNIIHTLYKEDFELFGYDLKANV